ncbi:TlpA family protein disulfide reductase [Actinomadura madurae]|uniref:TlpA family protein disulfide reductase n=1 Tax=Actinomadura madurae TaxID=1993 RepID=UPI002026D93B|nr:peroxiredoxin family protein [Actinomadura madurae]MCP9949597.1 peroxiredoxin family protein [Actinomadura madurae]MCP9966352.1 peroxiredoxin family protein [Actinomadura madurae]MCP9978842.1 peroxiredoxin family protein [Actinomadura madurae]MCQ0009630.1 peroxiredoxin family protein [Actinomadura madurae]MCQ0015029.1 peroxiredoxin family protein [Actinomadura madurae]
MMPATAALAVLALAVSLLDLVLTLGVIRRLREHTELISNVSSGGRRPYAILDEGETAGPFDAVATTGEPVSRDLLSGRTLVGAFTPRCSACEEKLPAFLDSARTFPGGRDQVIAVVVGPEDEAETYRERLEPVARVVVEPPATGAVGTALALGSFPAFGVLDQSGTVVGSGVEPDGAPAGASPAGTGV